jgi:hypothetical protein
VHSSSAGAACEIGIAPSAVVAVAAAAAACTAATVVSAAVVRVPRWQASYPRVSMMKVDAHSVAVDWCEPLLESCGVAELDRSLRVPDWRGKN